MAIEWADPEVRRTHKAFSEAYRAYLADKTPAKQAAFERAQADFDRELSRLMKEVGHDPRHAFSVQHLNELYLKRMRDRYPTREQAAKIAPLSLKAAKERMARSSKRR